MKLEFEEAHLPVHGSGLPRSKGLHMSDCTKFILMEEGNWPYNDDEDERTRLERFEAGFLWEDTLSRTQARRNVAKRPPELHVDLLTGPLYFSPDEIEHEPTDGTMYWVNPEIPVNDYLRCMGPVKRLHEHKFTKLGFPIQKDEDGTAVREKFRNNNYWIMQAKGYLWALNCLHCTHHVCHINGAYGKDWKTRYVRYHTEFEPEEIAAFGRQITATAERLAPRYAE